MEITKGRIIRNRDYRETRSNKRNDGKVSNQPTIQNGIDLFRDFSCGLNYFFDLCCAIFFCAEKGRVRLIEILGLILLAYLKSVDEVSLLT